MKIHKVVEDSQGHKINICGSNRWQMVHSTYDEAVMESLHYVNHYGRQYSLDEFMAVRRTNTHPSWMDEFDGYHSDSFFSGVLIKLSDCGESAKVFTFIS